MRFEVPQFIEIEDKIVGPLTWRQFIYIAGGIGLIVSLYLYAPFMVFVFFGLPIGALAASLSFQKVNNRPFSLFLEAGFQYFTKHKLYLWKRDTMQSVIDKEVREADVAKTLPFTNKNTLTSLSKKLEHNLPK
jgi:hypothetical protein